jgi:hypothetical protein
VLIPVLGARRVDQLRDNLGAQAVELPEAALRRLDEVSAVELGFPHDFLNRGRGFVFGETYDLVVDHRR